MIRSTNNNNNVDTTTTQTSRSISTQVVAHNNNNNKTCSFCQMPVAVLLQDHGKSLTTRPLCLLHYYTSRAVRESVREVVEDNNKKKMTSSSAAKRNRGKGLAQFTGGDTSSSSRKNENLINNKVTNIHKLIFKNVKDQMPEVQLLFAEAYTELQSDLTDIAAEELRKKNSSSAPSSSSRRSSSSYGRGIHKNSSTTTSLDDPLGAVLGFNTSTRKPIKQRVTTTTTTTTNNNNNNNVVKKFNVKQGSGGFLTQIKVPKKVLDHQEKVKKGIEQSISKVSSQVVKKDDVIDVSTYNPYKRRKSTKSTYWNIGETSNDEEDVASHRRTISAENTRRIQDQSTYKCSCGSSNVRIDEHMSGRADIAKGETWGNKERNNTLLVRCQCIVCGKVWNEEE